MTKQRWTEKGEELTSLILEVFRLNGALLMNGDRLVAELGLTSARWQVLGTIAYAIQPAPVAWHARKMGVSRQGVQRIINEMEEEGILEFQPNPHHKRAQLVVLTSKGNKLFEAAHNLQAPWANAIADDLKLKDIKIAKDLVQQIRERLDV